MRFCGAAVAASLQKCVWMWGRSQQWWDYDVNGFTETDFIQKFRISRDTFNYICQRLSSLAARHFIRASDVKVTLN